MILSFRASLVVLMVAVRAAGAQCPDGSAPPCVVDRAPPAFSVAVLGFRAIGGDSSDALIGEGLAEELTSRLGQIARLTVTSRSVLRRLPNIDAMPVQRIGQALNSHFLVQGSLRRRGGQLRVTAELLRASTGAVAWSEQYDRSDEDILTIQEVVATSIAQAVAGRLLPVERSTLAVRPTRSADAYRAYLRGRAHYLARLSVNRLADGVREFQQAVALDSAFAQAWAWLSIMHSTAYWHYLDRSDARLDSASRAAARARALAPSALATHLALGIFYYRGRRDYGRSLQEFTAALTNTPRDPLVHSEIANVARRQGDFALSQASRTRAIEIDPSDAGELLERASTYRVMRRYDDAERDLRRAIAINPQLFSVHMYRAQIGFMRDGAMRSVDLDSVAAHVVPTVRSVWATSMSQAVWRLRGPHQEAITRASPELDVSGRIAFYLTAGIVHASRGDTSSAIAALDTVRRLATERLRERPDDDLLLATLAQAHAGLGSCQLALPAAERATAVLPLSVDALTGPARLEVLAEIEAQCGRVESAIDRLELLLRIPSNVTPQRLRVDPAFAPLRANARFLRLAAGR